ncbi:MAG: DedA family protein [Rhabdochlamydiaceae bacterium]|jgi:membrane protein DedA with SNARE-associated domain
MTTLIEWITQHSGYAHWLIFGGALIAGLSIPISIDLLIMTSGLLAATVVPEHTIHLFLAISLGSFCSAAIAYWVGRLGGKKLLTFSWFAKLLPPERLEKIQKFYHKRGLITLIIGRFIPFGVRNCMFMSIGISSFSFIRFLLWDLVAVSIWSSSCFYLFYKIGENHETLYAYLKNFHFLIFISLGVTLIAFIWYNAVRRK